jgi:hypothetical protein
VCDLLAENSFLQNKDEEASVLQSGLDQTLVALAQLQKVFWHLSMN